MNPKRKTQGVSIGTSSLLVIIVILCLICFASLSIVSASADRRLSQKLADRTMAYYSALSQGHEQLARLAQKKEPIKDSLSYSYPVSDSQALVLTVSPCVSDDKSSFFVSSFQLETYDEPEMDQSLHIFTGD